MIGLSDLREAASGPRVRAGAALVREASKTVIGLGCLGDAASGSGVNASRAVVEEAEVDAATGLESLGIQVKVLGFFEGGASDASVVWSCKTASGIFDTGSAGRGLLLACELAEPLTLFFSYQLKVVEKLEGCPAVEWSGMV